MPIAGFATQLTTLWGIRSRLEPSNPPAKNTIPAKLDARDTAEIAKNGARYTLTEKMCSDAIIKGNIVMIINKHFEGQQMPKCPFHVYQCLGSAQPAGIRNTLVLLIVVFGCVLRSSF